MHIEDVRAETSMRVEELPFHHTAHAQVAFCHVSNMIALRIHDDILVGLLKPQHHIHKLKLSRDHDARMPEDARGRVSFVKYAV